MEIPDYFWNKELCDWARIIATESVCMPELAIELMKLSNDYDRDAFVIMKLSNCGFGYKQLRMTIEALNK